MQLWAATEVTIGAALRRTLGAPHELRLAVRSPLTEDRKATKPLFAARLWRRQPPGGNARNA
jgi:hypothetical protein